MTPSEVVKYWLPAVRQVFGEFRVTVETCSELDTLLGIEEYRDFKYGDFDTNLRFFDPLPEDTKKLLVLLAGPHGKTILKVYRIRRGLE